MNPRFTNVCRNRYNMNNTLLQAKDLDFNLSEERTIRANFTLGMSEAHQISGRSGGGKTTLLRVIALLTPRISGDIYFQGKESRQFAPFEWRRKICYLAQKPTMLPGTVEDNLKAPTKLKISGKRQFDGDICAELLEILGLEKDIMNKDASVISGGEASRVALVRAIQSDPQVILADEITAPLDDDNANLMVKALSDWLKGGERGLIFVAHQDSAWRVMKYSETEIEEFLNHRLKADLFS